MTSVTSVGPADPTPAPLSKLPSLTGLRWIAAMLVFGFHVGTLHIIADQDYLGPVSWLFKLGASGVQFFFVLSGFVLVWSARPGDTKRAFWRRRVAKIYPNHMVTWAIVVAIAVYWADPVDIKVALTNLFLLQAWTPAPGYAYSINTVSWSLSCEMFFYLCLPLALPLFRRMRPWVLVAIIVAVPLLILSLWPAQELLPNDTRWWFTQLFPPIRSLEFWMGVAAGELMVRGRWRGPNLLLSSAIFVTIWVAATEWIRAEMWAAILAAAYLLVIAAAAHADVRRTWSPWRSRVMVFLGEVSFAYYLVHVFVIETVLRWRNHPGGWEGWKGPVAAVGFLLVNLFLAWLLFRFVETPMMRILGPKRRRRPPQAPSESSAEPAPAPAEDAAEPPGREGDREPVGSEGDREPVGAPAHGGPPRTDASK